MNQFSQLDLRKPNTGTFAEQKVRYLPLNIFRLQVLQLVTQFCEEISKGALNPVVCKQLKFRSMTSRWGTCSTKGVITINTKLKNLPLQLVEFVVFHECLHLMHMNHGVNFKKRIQKRFPNKKELEHQLKLFGLSEL